MSVLIFSVPVPVVWPLLSPLAAIMGYCYSTGFNTLQERSGPGTVQRMITGTRWVCGLGRMERRRMWERAETLEKQ